MDTAGVLNKGDPVVLLMAHSTPMAVEMYTTVLSELKTAPAVICAQAGNAHTMEPVYPFMAYSTASPHTNTVLLAEIATVLCTLAMGATHSRVPLNE
jgi:hypothetical protein